MFDNIDLEYKQITVVYRESSMYNNFAFRDNYFIPCGMTMNLIVNKEINVVRIHNVSIFHMQNI